jgi:hypothetical protein
VVTTLRITDLYNGPTSTEPASLNDLPLSFTAPCVSTPSASIGSTCSVVTGADAATGGAVLEGKRSIWELGQTKVFDGGPDGDVDTPDNTLFEIQGLFTP